jgi:hypothetical protein
MIKHLKQFLFLKTDGKRFVYPLNRVAGWDARFVSQDVMALTETYQPAKW